MTIDKIKQLDRYKNFTFLNPHQNFQEMFKDINFDTVQIMDSAPAGDDDILGFVGAFEWNHNEITPLDGDIYVPNMQVVAFEEYKYTDTNGTTKDGLDILVEESGW